MSKKHMGSSIDEFLREEGIFEEAQAQAVKEVVAWQLAQAMKKKKISKSRMAALSSPEPDPGCVCSIPQTISRFPAFSGCGSHGGAPGFDRAAVDEIRCRASHTVPVSSPLGSPCLAPSVAQQPGRTAAPLRKGISVNLPITRNATPVPDAVNQDSLIVAVTRDGSVFLGLRQMTESALTAAVRAGLSNQAGRQVYIKVDSRTSYANVGKILDSVRAAQVDSVILLTSQSSPATAAYATPQP